MKTTRLKQAEELRKAADDIENEDAVSSKEFNLFVKIVTTFLKDVASGSKKDVADIRKALLDELSTAKKDLESNMAEKFSSYEKKLSDALSKAESVTDGYTPQKGIDYLDGKDADPEAIADLVLKLLTPKGMTREELGELQELSDKFDEIKEDLRTLRSRPFQGGQNNASVSGRSIFHDVDISSQLDGVLKTFNIQAFYMIISVFASSHPYALRKNIDYTYNGNLGTITFTDQITASATLAAGQTVILTLVNA